MCSFFSDMSDKSNLPPLLCCRKHRSRPSLAAAALRALPFEERPAVPSTMHQSTKPNEIYEQKKSKCSIVIADQAAKARST